MTLGEEIKMNRERLGLSHAALGKLVGVSRQMIGLYEKDEAHPTRGDTADKLSQVLGIAPERFTTAKKGGAIRFDSAPDVHIIPLFDLSRLIGGLAGLAKMLAVKDFSETDGLKVSTEYKSCFSVQLTDDAMIPEYKSGDVLIIDQCSKAYDGNPVLVALASGEAIVRFCKFRGFDNSGTAVYDLSTPNPNKETITLNGKEPYEILGVVAEMRRVPGKITFS